MPLPVIAIVGRPNVGKSSLLNALVGKRISIVQDQPGVTRDRVSTELPIDGRWVELVDTGGYGFVDPDKLTEHIKHQIELAMARADLVLFVVDTQAGLTSADQNIATLLRRQGIKTVLIANKADGPRLDNNLAEFARLGFGTPVGVSATNQRNLDNVFDAIRENLDLSDAPTELPDPEMMLAIVGKRNAGKSTLVNAIAGLFEGDPDRVIVSEVPGTTRDSVDVRIEKEGKPLVVIDTAGVRKKRHMVTNDIEFYSFHRAQRSIRRAHVVLLLIDATEPVSEPDKKLAQYVAEQFKPVVIVINKWDLARGIMAEQKKEGAADAPDDRALMEKYREYLDLELKNLDYAPVAFITAKEGKNVQAVVNLAQHIFNQALQRLPTSRLNRAIRQVLQERTPPTASGRRAKVFYATQVDVLPPQIVLVVNNPAYFDETYQRYLVNRLRDLLPYPEVPIRILIRGRGETVARSPHARSLAELSDAQVDEMEVDPATSLPARAGGPAAAPKAKAKKVIPKPKSYNKPVRKKGPQSQRPQPKRTRTQGARRGTRPK
jgi:GTPase